jgi:hypothetical protein
LLLCVLLSIEAHDGAIEQNPVLPAQIEELELRGLPGPAGSYDAVAGVATRVLHRSHT